MGPLFALVAACMVAVVSCSSDPDPPAYNQYPPRRPHSGYPPRPHGYGHDSYSTPPRRNLYNELHQAKVRVANLAATDARQNSDLDDVMLKINSASDFRVEFLEEIYPHLQENMHAQDQTIEHLTATLKDQLALIDEVNELTAKVKSILTNIAAARQNHQQIISDLIGLENTEREQRIAISNIAAEGTDQEHRLDEAEGKIEDNEAAGERIYNKLVEVVNVVNNDRAEVFSFEVDNSAPVEITFSRPFSTNVYFNYAIKGYHVEEQPRHEGYGSDGHKDGLSETILESLFIDGDTREDDLTYGGTISATLEENIGWGPVKYTACVIAYHIDNTIIEDI